MGAAPFARKWDSKHIETGDAVVAENTDFDKLVGIQADVDFFQNGIGQAGIARS